MRRAFIGLSTPIGFDYRHQASKAPADGYSSPNPILDSPFGLLLLFDELVFLTRSLCPENMRGLPYVKFLDETNGLPEITRDEVRALQHAVWNDGFQHAVESRSHTDVIKAMGLPDDMLVDNHSHGLDLGTISGAANPTLGNLAIDMLVHSRLNDPTLEMIANSCFQPAIEQVNLAPGQVTLAEAIVIEGIPNYLTAKGPYHEVIEDVRADQYLSNFRRWIAQKPKSLSAGEILEMKRDVEHALREAQETTFLRHLESKRHFQSVGKAVLGDVVGLLIPGTGVLSALAEGVVGARRDKNQHWQGFLTSARRATRGAVSK